MDRLNADMIVLQITNNILKTNPSALIKQGYDGAQAAIQVSNFISTLAEKLEKEVTCMTVNFGDFQ